VGLRPFGTDQLGRHTLARISKGGQTSVAVGLTAMGLSLPLQPLLLVIILLSAIRCAHRSW